MKRPGDDEPAFAQTISGAWELFHEVVSARMRVLSSGEVQSALMARKRWVGALACDCVALSVSMGIVEPEYMGKYLDVLNCLIEFVLIPCDNADIGTLLCHFRRESFTHTTRTSCNQDCLCIVMSACVHQPEWSRQTHPALDGEMLVG